MGDAMAQKMPEPAEINIRRTYTVIPYGDEKFLKFIIRSSKQGVKDGSLQLYRDSNEVYFKGSSKIPKDNEGMARLWINGKETNVEILGEYTSTDGKLTIVFVSIGNEVKAGYISGYHEEEGSIEGLKRKIPEVVFFEPITSGIGAEYTGNQQTIGGITYNIIWIPPVQSGQK